MTYDVDLIVIGGGSSGLAAAKAAAEGFGKRVVLFDFVAPTVHGSKWGLGGTCVNVGCIPKKLMHRSARIGQMLKHDADAYGWKVENAKFSWEKMAETVQNYVKQLNFSYRKGLRSAKVDYVNAYVKIQADDPHTVEYTDKGEQKQMSAEHLIIACGGRPYIPPDVENARRLAITSDDIFWKKSHPGKTLVVGGSYIALECAGFLTEMGVDTTVCVRSVLLRGFDHQCADKVGRIMLELGTKFRFQHTVKAIHEQEGGRLLVVFSDHYTEIYDTVLYATGRKAQTEKLGLAEAGIKLTDTGKIVCDETDCTTQSHIFALGDAVHGRPELVPTAIRAAELLIKRVYGGSKTLMDYYYVPTAVFTPVEYGCVGLSEESAIEKYGADNVETYLFEFNPVEVSAAHWKKASGGMDEEEEEEDMSVVCLSKLVCTGKDEKIVGYHCVGPSASEITQGYALAIKMGACKSHVDGTLGIHPTEAESFHSLTVTRRSGETWIASGGCGGGKCG